ncbi:MAG: CotH kinase family protein [Chitinispirillia bacterium]|nr:CotH kinase family protein [Chitinispirillia bacterium]MCL2242065.1 CotH kinase family protein [Chitinispirillia bacterium]
MKHKSFAVRLATALVVCASALAWSQSLPVMKITVAAEPTVSGGGMFGGAQTMNYVRMTKFQLTGHPDVDIVQGEVQADSIRVRGNSTAGMDKKPYRIKFAKEQSLFGKPKANSWVLLANYYDHTMALNAVAFALGQRLKLKHTPTSQYVDLYFVVNGQERYKGIYQLTEQIQVKKDRVNVDKTRGWLVEFDYHDAETGQIKFRTTNYQLFTRIRSPEVAGCDANPPQNCNDNNAAVSFVKNEVNELCNTMAASGFPTNGYRDMIDMESWAKYVLIQQLIDNFDFNNKAMAQQGGGMFGGGNYGAEPGSNYAFRDYDTSARKALPIVAGPLWDFDLAAGVHPTQSFPTHYVNYNEPIRPKHSFYQRLWDDPEFLKAFKKAWDDHQADFNAMPALVDSIANVIRYRVVDNFNAYGGSSGGWGMAGGEAKPTNVATFDTRVNGFKTWWNNRMRFFGDEINKLNIPSTPVVSTYTLTAGAEPAAGGTVTPTSQSNINSGTQIPISAAAANGYTFQYWTLTSGSATFFDATSASTTISLSSNATIRANFTKDSDPPHNTSGDTIRVEAETMTPAAAECPAGGGSGLATACRATSGNMTYVRNPVSTTATYTVNVSADDAGFRNVVFRIAANSATSFTVTVNGTPAGTISVHSTGGTNSSNYALIPLASSIELNQGANTIVLAFNGSVYADYFELIRTDKQPDASVRYSVNKSVQANVVLTKSVRGFSAALPGSHGFTSYKLIDPRGRTIRSGSVANGAATLKFDNLPKGMLFLNLEGRNVSKTLRTVTY